MKISDVTKILDSRRKGGIITVLAEKPIKLSNGLEAKKKTRFQIRSGVDYENLATTKEKRATGKTPSVPWYRVMVGDNRFAVHKTSGQFYLLGQPVRPLNDRSVCESTFEFLGHEMSKDEVARWVPAKDRAAKGGWVTIPLDSITEIH